MGSFNEAIREAVREELTAAFSPANKVSANKLLREAEKRAEELEENLKKSADRAAELKTVLYPFIQKARPNPGPWTTVTVGTQEFERAKEVWDRGMPLDYGKNSPMKFALPIEIDNHLQLVYDLLRNSGMEWTVTITREQGESSYTGWHYLTLERPNTDPITFAFRNHKLQDIFEGESPV
jgi:hypothetical protein